MSQNVYIAPLLKDHPDPSSSAFTTITMKRDKGKSRGFQNACGSSSQVCSVGMVIQMQSLVSGTM